jgi:hypothetical protein
VFATGLCCPIANACPLTFLDAVMPAEKKNRPSDIEIIDRQYLLTQCLPIDY